MLQPSFSNPNKAVKTTLDYALEKGYIQIRKGKGGKIKEKVKNGIFALFSHTTNRNLEPHEHIHTLVAIGKYYKNMLQVRELHHLEKQLNNALF